MDKLIYAVSVKGEDGQRYTRDVFKKEKGFTLEQYLAEREGDGYADFLRESEIEMHIVEKGE